MNVNDIEIEYHGDIRTIGYMKDYLETGHATYWHWHTLLNDFVTLYRKTKDEMPYGVLMQEYPTIAGTTNWSIEAAISQGGYDKKVLFAMIDMYEFLLNENEVDIKFQNNVCAECDDKEHCDKTDNDIENCMAAFTPLEKE